MFNKVETADPRGNPTKNIENCTGVGQQKTRKGTKTKTTNLRSPIEER